MKVTSREKLIEIVKREGEGMEGSYKGFDYHITRQKETRHFIVMVFIDDKMRNIDGWQNKITPHGGVSWEYDLEGRYAFAFDFGRTGDLSPFDAIHFGIDEGKNNYWSLEEVQEETGRVIDELVALKKLV